MLKELWNELDLKGITEECGIFVAIIMFIVTLLTFILVLPIAPFYAFNEWSKTWFNNKIDD